VYTDITPSCIRRTREVYTAVRRPYTGRPGPCRRPLCGRVRAVYTLSCRVVCPLHGGRAHGPSPPPVYMTVYGPSARTSFLSCTWRVHGPIHGTCTRPCMGRTHGRVHDTYTAAYTCLRVQVPCTRPCAGHLHGRKRPSTRPYTAV